MSRLKPKTVQQTVQVWNILFGGQRSDAELAVICTRFFEALEHVYSDESFIQAAKLVEKETSFFPTIKNMMDVRESANQIRDRIASAERLSLPEETENLTEEEITQNQRKIEVIKKMLCGEMSMAEAEIEQKKLTHYSR